jgi:hypothetical protein
MQAIRTFPGTRSTLSIDSTWFPQAVSKGIRFSQLHFRRGEADDPGSRRGEGRCRVACRQRPDVSNLLPPAGTAPYQRSDGGQARFVSNVGSRVRSARFESLDAQESTSMATTRPGPPRSGRESPQPPTPTNTARSEEPASRRPIAGRRRHRVGDDREAGSSRGIARASVGSEPASPPGRDLHVDSRHERRLPGKI